MQTITLWFMLLFVAIGLLFVGLSVPLIRRRVKPNHLYGFRTPKTMSNEQIWYDANVYAGRTLLWAGIVFIVVVVIYFVLRTNFIAYNIVCAVVGMTTVLTATALSFRHLRSL